MRQSCGEALIQLLESYGVSLVFGIPGEHSLELYRGIGKRKLTFLDFAFVELGHCLDIAKLFWIAELIHQDTGAMWCNHHHMFSVSKDDTTHSKLVGPLERLT